MAFNGFLIAKLLKHIFGITQMEFPSVGNTYSFRVELIKSNGDVATWPSYAPWILTSANFTYSAAGGPHIFNNVAHTYPANDSGAPIVLGSTTTIGWQLVLVLNGVDVETWHQGLWIDAQPRTILAGEQAFFNASDLRIDMN